MTFSVTRPFLLIASKLTLNSWEGYTMNWKNVAILGLLLGSATTFADTNPTKWGARELRTAIDFALDMLGDEHHANVTGFSIARNVQGIAGNATITYLDGGVKKTASYFCHYHEGEAI